MPDLEVIPEGVAYSFLWEVSGALPTGFRTVEEAVEHPPMSAAEPAGHLHVVPLGRSSDPTSVRPLSLCGYHPMTPWQASRGHTFGPDRVCPTCRGLLGHVRA